MESGGGYRRHMTTRRRRPRAAGRGLSLEWLNKWFNTLRPPARVDGVSILDGYLTAIVIGPCSIPPDEWFKDPFGARGRIAVAAETMLGDYRDCRALQRDRRRPCRRANAPCAEV